MQKCEYNKVTLEYTSNMMYNLIVDTKWNLLYYVAQDGSIPVKEYIEKLSFRERAKTMAYIELLEGKGPNLPRPYADILQDGIHELRIKLKGTQVRVLYFFCYQSNIILTNVFDKHTQRVPVDKIDKAKDNRDDFLRRYSDDEIRRMR